MIFFSCLFHFWNLCFLEEMRPLLLLLCLMITRIFGILIVIDNRQNHWKVTYYDSQFPTKVPTFVFVFINYFAFDFQKKTSEKFVSHSKPITFVSSILKNINYVLCLSLIFFVCQIANFLVLWKWVLDLFNCPIEKLRKDVPSL